MSQKQNVSDRNLAEVTVKNYLDGLKKSIDLLQLGQIVELLRYIESAYNKNQQIWVIGNGGSAATASHLACDLSKNILKYAHPNQPRCRVMSLTDNIAWISALANDISYESVFSEQLKNVVQADDLVIVISGSGNSPNILEAVRTAKQLKAKTVGILGFDGGKVGDMLDGYVVVDSQNYGYIEDIHLSFVHVITEYFAHLLSDQKHPIKDE